MLFLIIAAQMAYGAGTARVLQSQKIDLPSRPNVDLRSTDLWRFNWSRERLFRIQNSKTIFDTIVNRDKNGFRLIPDTEKKRELRYHMFFGGCSFTFGEGLEDAETFPAMVSLSLPQTRVVNMGAPGTGVAEQLYLWKNFNWNEKYKEQEGVLFFSMIDDHFERLSRTWRYLDWVPKTSPYFEMRDNKLIQAGIIGETIKYRWSRFMKELGLSEVWLRGSSHFAPLTLKNSIPSMVEHLQALKSAYLEQFPKGKFIVIWRPFFPPWTNEERGKEVIEALKQARIEYWDYPIDWELFHRTGGRDARIIIGDGHANVFSNREYTEHLVQKIKSTTSQPTL